MTSGAFAGWDESVVKDVVRVRPRRTTDRQDEYLDYADPASRDVAYECIVAPITGSEQEAGRNSQTTQWSVIDMNSGPGWWDADDHLLIDDVEYQIEGVPQVNGSPTGALAHTYLVVNRTEG